MLCPKCQHQQVDGLAECQRCGIIFSKYYAATQNVSSSRLEEVESSDEVVFERQSCWDWFTQPLSFSGAAIWGRAVVFVLLFIWGCFFIVSSIDSNYAGESFLHLINLPFHEAGHLLFRPLGQFMMSLGGTLGQLLMPLVCLFYMLIKMRDNFSASVCLWWFGQNFFDIAPYINDARAGELLLLGGNTGHSAPYGFHDWEYLLTETGYLQHDHTLARISVVLATLIFVLSWVWGAVVLYRAWQERSVGGVE